MNMHSNWLVEVMLTGREHTAACHPVFNLQSHTPQLQAARWKQNPLGNKSPIAVTFQLLAGRLTHTATVRLQVVDCTRWDMNAQPRGILVSKRSFPIGCIESHIHSHAASRLQAGRLSFESAPDRPQTLSGRLNLRPSAQVNSRAASRLQVARLIESAAT